MKQYLALLALAVAMPFASSTNAALVFVDYWDVAGSDAPSWSDSPPFGPLAYTGQEAAAYLFGGTASNYTISTVDDTVANINHMAWYDIIGYGGNIFAQDYSSKFLGQYYGPSEDYTRTLSGAASAFVRDNLTQGVQRNYAFKDDGVIVRSEIPEPSILSLLLLGFMSIAAGRRRTKTVAWNAAA